MTNRSVDLDILRSVLKEILEGIREFSECQSVAIRLYKEGDFPYYLHIGFPEFFIRKESVLNVRDREGNLVLAADGTPFVECVCGNVLKSRVNPQYPYFTKDGAFWTNSTTRLLESLTERERQEIGRTRNTCHDYGYESVALIPIHADGKTIGLIQINDPREDMFTLEKVEKYQSLADHVGTLVINILEFYEKVAHALNPESKVENVEK
jgi:transcriptional regulator with GAF, ATPase, and Fis domain